MAEQEEEEGGWDIVRKRKAGAVAPAFRFLTVFSFLFSVDLARKRGCRSPSRSKPKTENPVRTGYSTFPGTPHCFA